MNEEQQNIPEKSTEENQDTSKLYLTDSALETKEEFENNKTDNDYYAVDKPKKELSTTIGDGEMRNEGTVGEGDIPEDNPLINQGVIDDQDKAELRDSGS